MDEQRTAEWFEKRRGKVTGTVAWKLLSTPAVIKELAYEKYAESHSECDLSDSGNKSKAMENGIMEEDGVRARIEMELDYEVKQIDFIELDKYRGCSPDGLVGKDGGLEIKCPEFKNHLKHLCGDIDKKYYSQMQWFMMCSKRAWCDFISYNKYFKEDIKVTRIMPDEEWLEKMQKGYGLLLGYYKEFDKILGVK